MYGYQRKKLQKNMILGSLTLMILLLSFMFLKNIFISPEREAKTAVQQFYNHEQHGEFSASWEMFHPYMQDKFPKNHYIQDRAHVFLNHFGVETFQVEIDEPLKIENWEMDKEHGPLESVYKVPVIKIFKGKYGNFSIHQDVFTIQDDEDDWKILWSFE